MDASAVIAALSAVTAVVIGFFTVRAQVNEQREREARARVEAAAAAERVGYERAAAEFRPQLERFTLELAHTERELGAAQRERDYYHQSYDRLVERQKGGAP